MDRTTILALNALNRRFYAARSAAFSATRTDPWPGWERLLPLLPDRTPVRTLDVGCGNARLARFLAGRLRVPLAYTGIDACPALLEAARTDAGPGLDLMEADFVADSPEGVLPPGPFDLIALFGVLHHVPGRTRREALLRASALRLAPGGVLAVSLWQFGAHERFDAKTLPWSTCPEIDPKRLEAGDALLAWGGTGGPPRFCHFVDEAEADALLADLGLVERAHFVDDGELNVYRLLVRSP